MASWKLVRALTPARLAVAVALLAVLSSVYQVWRAPPVLVAAPSLAAVKAEPAASGGVWSLFQT
jgi:hypothetical protein